jgi:hypothetical protein
MGELPGLVSNGWELIHQHASVPAGGEWDGEITTA